MDILKKIFILVLLFFPLGEIIRIDWGNNIVMKPLDIGLGILVFLWIIIKLKKREKIKQKYIFISVIFFALSAAFSLLINYSSLSYNQFLTSFSYLVRWVMYACTFFVVTDFDKIFKNKIENLLIMIGSLIVVLGYIQYFFYSNLKNLFYLGWDEHMHRMFSVFLDPNFAGIFFVLFFLFIASILIKKRNVLFFLLSILALGAVFLTFSRSALTMLIVSSSLLFILENKKKLIGILLGITFLVLIISSRYFNIENINLFRVFSSQARIGTAENAIKIIQDHPIFGVGFNAYRYVQIRYGFRIENAISHADSGADNSILFILATTGLVGFSFYLLLWITILKSNINNPLILASIAGLFTSSLFINSLFYPFIMLWIWIIIAVRGNR